MEKIGGLGGDGRCSNLTRMIRRTGSLDASLSKLLERLDKLQAASPLTTERTAEDGPAAIVDSPDVAAPQVAVDSGLVYEGCFGDNLNARDLPTLTNLFSVDPRRCAHACYMRGTKYAGLQDGAECWCGDRIGTHGSSTACTRPCTGQSALRCGGPFANDVYRAAPAPDGQASPVEVTATAMANDSSVACWQNHAGKRCAAARRRLGPNDVVARR